MTEMSDIKDLSKIYVIIYVRFNFQRYSLLSVGKNLFFYYYFITATSREHTISSVHYHIKIIVIKLLEVKLNAKIGSNKLLLISDII